jgi:spore germination protein KC
MRCVKKKLCAALVAASVLVSLCGCYDRRELDTLGIVMAVAVDKGEEEGVSVLTVQLANPAAGQTSSKQSGSSSGGAKRRGMRQNRISTFQAAEETSITRFGKFSAK